MDKTPSAEALIVDAAELAEICAAARATGSVAFDLEFNSADRYVPDLCLVQLGWGDGADVRAVCVDALAVDIAPIVALVEDPAIEIVAHAPKQDLQLLARRYGVVGRRVIDSQIAAAFAGYGEQIGYGKMCKALLNIDIDKGAQFTDWAKRPLSQRQVTYALGDVLHLRPAWLALRAELEARHRLDWVIEESDAQAAACAKLPDPQVSYLNVSGAGGLKGRSLGALQALAAWREELALADNTPPSWILPDPALVELCRRLVKVPDDLRKIRGVGSATVRKYGEQITRAIASGAKNPPQVEVPKKTPLSPIEQIKASVCQSIVAAACMDQAMPPRFVGPRAEVEALVRAHASGTPGDLSLAAGWRWSFIGQTLWAWMNGERTVSMAGTGESGLELRPIEK